MEELDKGISEIVRSTVNGFMESLMKGEIQAFLEQNNGQRNGYYQRDLGTRYGKIDDLHVPRDRNNEFQTALFDRYQRNVGIDDLVISCIQREYKQERWLKYWKNCFIINTVSQQYPGSPTSLCRKYRNGSPGHWRRDTLPYSWMQCSSP